MPRALQIAVIVGAVALIILASALASVFALRQFDRELQPAEREKAVMVSQVIADLVSDMLDYGIPLDRLRGLDEVFARVQKKHPDIIYISIETSQAQALYERVKASGTEPRFYSVAESSTAESIGTGGLVIEQFVSEIVREDAAQAKVRVGIDRHYLLEKRKEILLDIITVLVVAVLMALELLLFLFVFTIRSPLNWLRQAMAGIADKDFSRVYEFATADEVGRCGRLLNQLILKVNQFCLATPEQRQRAEQQGAKLGGRDNIENLFDQALIYMRPPLFLAIFAESMSLSFFPTYVDQLYASMPPLPISRDLVLGLPISLFMLVWASSLPLAGQWSDRVGRRKAFLAGATVTAVGLLLTSFSGDVYQLVLWRSLTAIGYGIVFITAQSYVTDLTNPQNRTKGMALFLSGFFSGSLCGAAIGGILADRIGFGATFVLSAILALGAALFAARFFFDHKIDKAPGQSNKLLDWRDIKALFANRAFLVITFFSAIPAKAALTGFIYYAAPVYLAHMGASRSLSGRILMAYGVAIILLSPLTAWLIDRYQRQRSFIIIGGMLSSLALLIVALSGNVAGLGFGILMLGIAHACSVSPQTSLISDTVVKSSGVEVGRTIGIYRLTERIGNISGPLVAGALITTCGFHSAFMGCALFLAVATLLCLRFIWMNSHSRRNGWGGSPVSGSSDEKEAVSGVGGS